MAEEKPAAKKDSSSSGPPDEFYTWMKIIFGILIVVAILLSGTIVNFGRDQDGKIDLVPTGTIAKGKKVIMKEDVRVRTRPGEAVLGNQLKRTKGVVADGPITDDGIRWWRVNFEEAPDGWVDERQFSSVIWLFILVNIVPYLIDIILPISITVIIACSVLILIINAKAKDVPPVNSKEEQAYLARTNRTEIIPKTAPTPEAIASQAPKANPKWQTIENHIESMNPNDWRQAIIEADIMLEGMLSKIGYEGLTLADKLKNVEPSDMVTLDDAWKAHKVRNRIAHDGSNFRLDHNEAKNTIRLYKNVFEEFYYI